MNKDTIPYVVENNLQLKFFNVQPHPDTTLIRMTATDSLGISAVGHDKNDLPAATWKRQSERSIQDELFLHKISR